jgi:hypothetical protein
LLHIRKYTYFLQYVIKYCHKFLVLWFFHFFPTLQAMEEKMLVGSQVMEKAMQRLGQATKRQL